MPSISRRTRSSGARIEAKAPYKVFLSDLNKQELINLIERRQDSWEISRHQGRQHEQATNDAETGNSGYGTTDIVHPAFGGWTFFLDRRLGGSFRFRWYDDRQDRLRVRFGRISGPRRRACGKWKYPRCRGSVQGHTGKPVELTCLKARYLRGPPFRLCWFPKAFFRHEIRAATSLCTVSTCRRENMRSIQKRYGQPLR